MIFFITELYSQQKPSSENFPKDYLLEFRTPDGAGFMDSLGNVLIPPKYYIVDLFKDGLTTVSVKSNQNSGRNAYYGAYNAKGEMIIPIGNYYCRNIGYGIIEVDKGYTKAFYNSEGEEIICCDTCRLEYMPDLKRIVVHQGFDMNSPHSIKVLSREGKLLFECFGNHLRRMNNIISVGQVYKALNYYQIDINYEFRLSNILNLDGSMFMDSISIPIGFYDNLGVISKNGFFALMDTNFHEIISYDQAYTTIARFGGADKPRFTVKRDGKSGVVNEKGDLLLPLKYDGFFSFHQGFLAYYDHDEHKYYYLTDKGAPIGAKEWDLHETFVDDKNGKKWFRVSNQEGKFGFINGVGHVIVPLKYDFLSPVYDFRSVYFNGEESGFIDIRNCFKTPIRGEWISDLRNGTAIVGLPQKGKGRRDYPCAQITSSVDEIYAM